MLCRKRFVASSLAIGLVLGLATSGFGGHRSATAASLRATDADVTRLTASLLEQSQFAHHPLDDQLAGALLDRYIDSLDGSHSLFLQSDLDEFASYRPTLANATREKGDTTAARVVFARFLQRIQERASYVGTTLDHAAFDFTGHDVYSFNREHAPHPRDLEAAKALWRQQLRAEYLQEKLNDERPEKIASDLAQRYAQQVKTMKSLTSDEALEGYLDALTHVYDPHSDYLGREQMHSFSIAMSLSLVGIGATLQTTDGYCTIHELTPGGPAERSGLVKPGDRIVAVAQGGQPPVDITNMPLTRSVELIRGPKGSTVTLTIIPAGAQGSPSKTASIVRDAVKLQDQEARARIVDLPTSQGETVRLGVIDLPSFYADMGDHEGAARRSATADVARLLGKLKAEGVRGVALDLRRNGGGSLEEAISLTGLFLRTGPVVQTRDQEGHVDVDDDPDSSVVYDGPLVLLTSRYSASASEILAGALQDYGRAVVVGDAATFGKGTVQNILPLASVMDKMGLAHAYDPGALKITTSKFYRPSGASTQLRGVASDIVLPSTSDLGDVSESSLKNPLPWDSVRPAPHDELNRVAPYTAVLRERSAKRVGSEEDFRDLSAAMAQLKETVSSKSVSLNEAERRQELTTFKARERAREAREAHATAPTTYAITLENASAPGLPPPLVASKKPLAGSSDAAKDLESSVDRSANDILLEEGERILADYVELLGRSDGKGPDPGGATAAVSAAATP